MSTLIINVFRSMLNYSDGNYYSETEYLKTYSRKYHSLDYEFVDSIYKKILSDKIDWMNYEFVEFDSDYYVNIELIYHGTTMSDKDIESINKAIKLLDEELGKVGMFEGKEKKNHLDKYSKIFELDKDGKIFTIAESDGGALVNVNEIKQVLSYYNINFEPLSISERRFDGGASGVASTILLFIIEATASGLTYDVIKKIIADKTNIPIEFINMRKIDSNQFNEFRLQLADRIKEDIGDLILYSMNKDKDEIFMVFKLPSKTINVRCDARYVIKQIETHNHFV